MQITTFRELLSTTAKQTVQEGFATRGVCPKHSFGIFFTQNPAAHYWLYVNRSDTT